MYRFSYHYILSVDIYTYIYSISNCFILHTTDTTDKLNNFSRAVPGENKSRGFPELGSSVFIGELVLR